MYICKKKLINKCFIKWFCVLVVVVVSKVDAFDDCECFKSGDYLVQWSYDTVTHWTKKSPLKTKTFEVDENSPFLLRWGQSINDVTYHMRHSMIIQLLWSDISTYLKPI